jgi:GntR family transcriptional regulator
MLPGERDLSDLLGVSRTTLRRVLSVLVDEGVLNHRQGVGTFVRREREPSSDPAFTQMYGFADDMRRRGFSASSREIERALVLPTAEEALVLACPPEAQVLRLSRVRYADDQPIAVEHAVAPASLLGDPTTVGSSLREALSRLGLRPVRALQRVRAVMVEDRDAERLGVPAKSAGLQIQRAAYLADGRCCDYTQSIYRADRYDVVSDLRSPPPRDGA